MGFEGDTGTGLSDVSRVEELGKGKGKGRCTFVCVILCNNIRIDIKWERSPIGTISCASPKGFGRRELAQYPEDIHD